MQALPIIDFVRSYFLKIGFSHGLVLEATGHSTGSFLSSWVGGAMAHASAWV
jgi:hypothetical protein